MAEEQGREKAHVYGEVNSPDDIRRINREIREEMTHATSRDQLTELKRRSDYLCTLTESPSWKKKFGDQIDEIRRVAIEENRLTTAHANLIASRMGWEATYDPWGEKRAARSA